MISWASGAFLGLFICCLGHSSIGGQYSLDMHNELALSYLTHSCTTIHIQLTLMPKNIFQARLSSSHVGKRGIEVGGSISCCWAPMITLWPTATMLRYCYDMYQVLGISNSTLSTYMHLENTEPFTNALSFPNGAVMRKSWCQCPHSIKSIFCALNFFALPSLSCVMGFAVSKWQFSISHSGFPGSSGTVIHVGSLFWLQMASAKKRPLGEPSVNRRQECGIILACGVIAA